MFLTPGFYWKIHKGTLIKTIIEVYMNSEDKRVRLLGSTGSRTLDEVVTDDYYIEKIVFPKISEVLNISYEERKKQLQELSLIKLITAANNAEVSSHQDFKSSNQLIAAILKAEGFKKTRNKLEKATEETSNEL